MSSNPNIFLYKGTHFSRFAIKSGVPISSWVTSFEDQTNLLNVTKPDRLNLLKILLCHEGQALLQGIVDAQPEGGNAQARWTHKLTELKGQIAPLQVTQTTAVALLAMHKSSYESFHQWVTRYRKKIAGMDLKGWALPITRLIEGATSSLDHLQTTLVKFAAGKYDRQGFDAVCREMEKFDDQALPAAENEELRMLRLRVAELQSTKGTTQVLAAQVQDAVKQALSQQQQASHILLAGSMPTAVQQRIPSAQQNPPAVLLPSAAQQHLYENTQHFPHSPYANSSTFSPHGASAMPYRRGPDNRTCYSCGQVGHIARQCSQGLGPVRKPRYVARGFNQRGYNGYKRCEYCGKTGHLIDMCWHLPINQQKQFSDPNQQQQQPQKAITALLAQSQSTAEQVERQVQLRMLQQQIEQRSRELDAREKQAETLDLQHKQQAAFLVNMMDKNTKAGGAVETPAASGNIDPGRQQMITGSTT
jgi:hypothetical protein